MSTHHPRQSQMTLTLGKLGPQWLADFEAFVRGWGKHGEFTGEEVVTHAKAALLPPESDKAWGAAINTLARRKVIVKTGRYAPRRQGNPAPVWRLA